MAPTSEIHILVIFSCDTGVVEQLALAAAVGAVQSRAHIRLRRIVNPGEAVFAGTERLDQDYVSPRESDTTWADGFVLAVPGPFSSHFLNKVESLGGLTGKPVVLFAGGHAGDALKGADILSEIQIDRVNRDEALLFGRRVAETGRGRQGSSLRQS
jgi:hypothetical protein